MVSAHDWKTVIGFEKEEVAWGTVAVGAAVDWQRFFEDDDLWMSREIVDLTGTEETRDEVEYAKGNYIFEGNTITNIECLADELKVLLECLFGDVAGSNPYTFTPAASSLPSMTIWKRAGEIYGAIVGCKVQAFEFAFAVGTMKATVEVRSKAVEYMESGAFPGRTYSNKKPFMFWGLAVTWGISSKLIKEGSLRFENGLPDTDFYSGSPYTYEHAEGVRVINGTMVLTYETKAQAEEFLSIPEKALVLTITSPHGDTLVFTLPRIIQTDGATVRKSENLYRIETPWRAYAPTDGSDIITAVLTTV